MDLGPQVSGPCPAAGPGQWCAWSPCPVLQVEDPNPALQGPSGLQKAAVPGAAGAQLMQSKGLNEGKGIPTEVLRSGCAGSHFHDRKSLGPRPLLWELQGLRACVPEAAFPEEM